VIRNFPDDLLPILKTKSEIPSTFIELLGVSDCSSEISASSVVPGEFDQVVHQSGSTTAI